MRIRAPFLPFLVAAGVVAAMAPTGAPASTPGGDVRLTNDVGGGYVSNYTMVTGTPYTDATLTECGRSRGRQNEPSVAIDPRNQNVLVGSSNDYCGVYNDGEDENGAPIPSGPIWLGYYRSTNGGGSFVSSPAIRATPARTPRTPTSAPLRRATRSWPGTTTGGSSPGRRAPATRRVRRRPSVTCGSRRSATRAA